MTLAPECAFNWDGAAVASLLFAVPLAITITALTVWLYRRSVAKAMLHAAGELVPVAAEASHGAGLAGPLRLTLVNNSVGPPVAQFAQSQAAMRALSGVYALAGGVQSVFITALYLWLNDIDFRPIRTLLLWVPFAWPIFLALSITATATRRKKMLVVAGYFVVLFMLDAAADIFKLRYQPGFGELLLFWVISLGFPTLVIVLLGNRAWRAVGFIALFFSFVLVGSYLMGFHGLGCLVFSTRSLSLMSNFNYLLTAWVLLLFFVTWWLFARMVRRYRHKRYSEQMLLLDSLWLLVTLSEILSQMASLGVASFYYLSGFVAYKIVTHAGLAQLRAAPAPQSPPALLMLRVFGFTARTRQLADQVGHYWRYSGPINMIGGTDLATSLMEPDELIQFWSRQLRKQFIASDADLQARLRTLDSAQDPDLRYRINEFFCHNNTWQATVKALARRSAVVLMDLRGFGAKNRGCEFELQMLLEVIPVARIVLLVGSGNEPQYLQQVLQAAWSKLSTSSPNHALAAPELPLFQVEDSSAVLPNLLSRLFAAAARTPGDRP